VTTQKREKQLRKAVIAAFVNLPDASDEETDDDMIKAFKIAATAIDELVGSDVDAEERDHILATAMYAKVNGSELDELKDLHPFSVGGYHLLAFANHMRRAGRR
jgi:hypothetical protein